MGVCAAVQVAPLSIEWKTRAPAVANQASRRPATMRQVPLAAKAPSLGSAAGPFNAAPVLAAVVGHEKDEAPLHGIADHQTPLRVPKRDRIEEARRIGIRELQRPRPPAIPRAIDARLFARPGCSTATPSAHRAHVRRGNRAPPRRQPARRSSVVPAVGREQIRPAGAAGPRDLVAHRRDAAEGRRRAARLRSPGLRRGGRGEGEKDECATPPQYKCPVQHEPNSP